MDAIQLGKSHSVRIEVVIYKRGRDCKSRPGALAAWEGSVSVAEETESLGPAEESLALSSGRNGLERWKAVSGE